MKTCPICATPHPNKFRLTCNKCRGVRSTWEKASERRLGTEIGLEAARHIVALSSANGSGRVS